MHNVCDYLKDSSTRNTHYEMYIGPFFLITKDYM